MVEYKMKRKPNVKNKYKLTISKIKKLKVGNREKICKPLFWRNEVIGAWCISGTTAKNSKDVKYGTENEFWMGIYDEDAKAYKGKFRFDFSTYGGMCGYVFEKFFDPSEMDNDLDFEIQEKFLEKINQLIDEGILVM